MKSKKSTRKKGRTTSRAAARRDLPAKSKARKVKGGGAAVPRVGDEVIVAFTPGDVRAPYVVGSLWRGDRPPA